VCLGVVGGCRVDLDGTAGPDSFSRYRYNELVLLVSRVEHLVGRYDTGGHFVVGEGGQVEIGCVESGSVGVDRLAMVVDDSMGCSVDPDPAGLTRISGLRNLARTDIVIERSLDADRIREGCRKGTDARSVVGVGEDVVEMTRPCVGGCGSWGLKVEDVRGEERQIELRNSTFGHKGRERFLDVLAKNSDASQVTIIVAVETDDAKLVVRDFAVICIVSALKPRIFHGYFPNLEDLFSRLSTSWTRVTMSSAPREA
jgi:hypothetical protein